MNTVFESNYDFNDGISNLSDQIFDIKEKCSDAEYKQLMDTVHSLYKNSNQVQVNQDLIVDLYNAQSSSDNDLIDMDFPEVRGTHEWYDAPIDDQARWCNMSAEDYIHSQFQHIHPVDLMYYQKHPCKIPAYLKNHSKLRALYRANNPSYDNDTECCGLIDLVSFNNDINKDSECCTIM